MLDGSADEMTDEVGTEELDGMFEEVTTIGEVAAIEEELAASLDESTALEVTDSVELADAD